MDASTQRNRLRDDLRRQFRGDLFVDPAARSLYASDASLFHVDPLAVAVPLDEQDLHTLVRYAYDRSIPLTPRGAGTGLAGETLTHGIVVDVSVHFRSVLGSGDDWVRVQPGVVLSRLNAELARQGRRFAPDPASEMSCTLGGMIATDASGGRAAQHGYTRDHVLGLRVMWDDGSADEVGEVGESKSGPAPSPCPRTADIARGVQEILTANTRLIASSRRRAPFNRCGYNLFDASAGPNPDLVRLLVGSEGTLALTTAATLRTIPLPGGRAGVAFGFAAFEAAVHAGQVASPSRPTACEVFDRRLISMSRVQSRDATIAIPHEAEAVLLVEYERDTPELAREAVASLISRLQALYGFELVAVPAYAPADLDQLWSMRATALPSLYALGKGPRPLAFVEDMGVHPTDLPVFVERAHAILKRFDVTASFLIHSATGQVHVRPILDPESTASAAKLWPLAEDLHTLAISLGGTISAQHGTGLSRTPWVEKQFGPLFPVFRAVKAVFDPREILNPGKIVGPDPSRPAWPLRGTTAAVRREAEAAPAETGTDRRESTPLLVWEAEELPRVLAACNGCGACRTADSALRMCPTFRATQSEAAAPRAKVNLFRSLLESGPESVRVEDVRTVADLCVNCKMCALECPGRANIPKLMLEAKAANHATHGLRRSAWFLARIDGLASLASKFSLTVNFLLARTSVRWVLEKVFGLARRRTLPALAFRSYMSRARRRGLTRRPAGDGAVAYFVDTYANLFDPAVAEATVAVLRHNGVPVYVPPRQRGCGAHALAQGDTDVARERLLYNVRRMADLARAGDTIVCSEPTAALFFRLDALGLADDPDVKSVAEHTVELTSYLWSLHREGRLKTEFQPLDVSIGHHVPCHIKALAQGVHGPALLALIPGVRVNKIDVSCSGMAGTYGLNANNLPVSLAAGQPMLEEFARPAHQHGSSECSACRLQMQGATGKRALHPVQYLALAYGLTPSVADKLRRPFRGRVSV